MSFSMDDAAYGEAARGLGLVVRLDASRPPGFPPWTVAISGVGRGDASNPAEAALKLRAVLLDAVRDAEEGRLARAALKRAMEALNQWAGRTGERHPSRCPWNDYEHDEEAIPACDCGLASLRAALEGETT